MSNRSNTRWGARQPPRRGGNAGGAGYDQNYDDYNYNQQYSSGGYDYESYDQSQSNYDRNSASSKRYPPNRNNYDGGNNYYYNPPPRLAKGNFAENNNNNNNKTNSSTVKKPIKKQEQEPSSPLPNKETETPGKYFFK